MSIFDRRLVRRHRDRAAPGLVAHDFLFRETAERLRLSVSATYDGAAAQAA